MNRIESFRAGINSSTSSFRQIAQRYLAIFLLLQISVAGAIPVGTVTTVAGNGTTGYSGDGGIATNATLNAPNGIAMDALGNIYFADSYNNYVRKVAASTGIISTIAGTGGAGSGGDGGLATSAQLNWPSGVALDSLGDLYIAEHGGHRIRKVSAATGVISTVAGNGNAGFGGDAGPATAAKINAPIHLAFDSADNLYIADWGNNRIRKVTNGVIQTVAGNSGSGGSVADGQLATSYKLAAPRDVQVDRLGNLYIAEEHRIRKVAVESGIISTVAGNDTYGFNGDGLATNSSLAYPSGITLDGRGNIYIADYYNHRVRKVSIDTGLISTVAGNGTGTYSGDGIPAISSSLKFPASLVLDVSGNLYISDMFNERIRMVNLGAGSSSASTPTAPQSISVTAGAQQITLSFSAPASTGGAAIDSYTVSCTGGGITKTATGSTSPLVITGLTAGVQYSCSVTAHNVAGDSVASTSVVATAGSSTTAPSAPQSVTVVPGTQQATLSFLAPATNGGAVIDSYTASCTDGGVTKTATGTTSPLVVTGLTAGVQYSCSVTAHNSAGSSTASTSVNVTPSALVTAPSAPQSVTVVPGIQQATLSFSAPATNGGAAIDSYTVSCTGGGITKTVTGTTSPLIVTGLTAGVQYSCSVTAHNSAGSSTATAGVSVTPSPSPSVGAEAVFYCAEALYSPVFNARAATVSSSDGKYFMRSYPSGWILGVTTDGVGFYFIPPSGSLTYLDTLANVSNAYCKPYGLGM
ncbi:MAG: fibronectin type III domain-containing protein [Sulfuricella sp.]|nr:fibronectin type III domain-containing protein [Sulfuricella sp.]